MAVRGSLAPLAAGAELQTLRQFNLGEEGDYRVPDGALVRPGPDAAYRQRRKCSR